jgi:hypothetical protein
MVPGKSGAFKIELIRRDEQEFSLSLSLSLFLFLPLLPHHPRGDASPETDPLAL